MVDLPKVNETAVARRLCICSIGKITKISLKTLTTYIDYYAVFYRLLFIARCSDTLNAC